MAVLTSAFAASRGSDLAAGGRHGDAHLGRTRRACEPADQRLARRRDRQRRHDRRGRRQLQRMVRDRVRLRQRWHHVHPGQLALRRAGDRVRARRLGGQGAHLRAPVPRCGDEGPCGSSSGGCRAGTGHRGADNGAVRELRRLRAGWFTRRAGGSELRWADVLHQRHDRQSQGRPRHAVEHARRVRTRRSGS